MKKRMKRKGIQKEKMRSSKRRKTQEAGDEEI